MACYYPIDAWRAKNPNPQTGKYGVTFSRSEAQIDCPMTVPCGKCTGCRIELSRQWSLRATHEAQFHAENCFPTLTYDDEHLPENRTLVREHPRKFLRSIRQAIRRKYPNHPPIRYMLCGEYGDPRPQNGKNIITGLDDIGRPHYHLLLFGFRPDDLEIYSTNKHGQAVYSSEFMEKIWGKGIVRIGEVNMQTAAYVARYSMKKQGGEGAEEHYSIIDPKTGQFFQREPEFMAVSNHPGIGYKWFQKYWKDCTKGYFTFEGNRFPIPKYYEKLMERMDDESIYDKYKERKRQALDFDNPENKLDRLRVREEVKVRRIKSLKRDLD